MTLQSRARLLLRSRDEGVRSYILARRAWVIQKELFDWPKVEAFVNKTGP